MTEPSSPALIAIWRAGADSALRTISTPVFWSSFLVRMPFRCSEARSRATPPPGSSVRSRLCKKNSYQHRGLHRDADTSFFYTAWALRYILHRHAPFVANGAYRKSTGRHLLQSSTLMTRTGHLVADFEGVRISSRLAQSKEAAFVGGLCSIRFGRSHPLPKVHRR